MRIVIFGAGAIGSYFGASLILAGNDVSFYERPGAAETLAIKGISLYRKGMVQKVSGLDVHTSIPSLKKEIPFDFGILAVKSYDTHKFLGSIRKYASFLPPILCLQNGVENESQLVEVFGEGRVIAGSVTTAIGREGPGVISVEKLRGVGIAGASPLVPAIVRAFNAAKLKARRYSSIPNMKWSKLLTNLPANASAAILNMTPAEIFEDQRLIWAGNGTTPRNARCDAGAWIQCGESSRNSGQASYAWQQDFCKHWTTTFQPDSRKRARK